MAASPTILVVTGNKSACSLWSGWLQGFGLNARAVGDGVSALRVWRLTKPLAVLIADLPPRFPAAQLAARIRDYEIGSPLPKALLLSLAGYSNVQEYEEQRAAGFDGVLSTPVTQNAIRTRLIASGLVEPGDPDVDQTRRVEARRTFWNLLDQDVQELNAALSGATWEGVRQCAHRIHGATKMFGIASVAMVAERLEHEADLRTPNPDRLRSLTAELSAAFATSASSLVGAAAKRC